MIYQFKRTWQKFKWIIASGILAISPGILQAQDHIPQTSGFSGFLLAGFGNFNVESNLLVIDPPLIEDAEYISLRKSDVYFSFALSWRANTFTQKQATV